MTLIACGMSGEPSNTEPIPENGPKPTQTCEKCGNDICPKCGDHCSAGYGLAFGGLGHYVTCNSCEFFYKEQDKT